MLSIISILLGDVIVGLGLGCVGMRLPSMDAFMFTWIIVEEGWWKSGM